MTSTTIVGGGAIGLSLAWELSRRGVAVTLLERDQIGRGTSWAAAGILPPANRETATDPIDRLRGYSHELFPQWARELQSATGIDCGLRRCGGWYLADTPGEQAAMIGMTEYWRQLGIECVPIAPAELGSREPALEAWSGRGGHRHAWWLPDEYQIRSPHFLQALAKACRQQGVELRQHAAVKDVRFDGDHTAARVGDDWIMADKLVACSGVWTGQIAQWLRLAQSLIPIRGQMLLLRCDRPPFHCVINVGHRYLIGREDGYVLIGSCEEEVGFHLETTESVLVSLRRFADDLCPLLRNATALKSWSGLRPMTFDGFPMIGRVPETDNVYVAAGHFRSGVHLAPATAVTLADLMLGHEPEIDLYPFRVGKQQTHDVGSWISPGHDTIASQHNQQ